MFYMFIRREKSLFRALFEKSLLVVDVTVVGVPDLGFGNHFLTSKPNDKLKVGNTVWCNQIIPVFRCWLYCVTWTISKGTMCHVTIVGDRIRADNGNMAGTNLRKNNLRTFLSSIE